MRIEERGLIVKANLFETLGQWPFSRSVLKDAICSTGLSPKSSSIQKVVNFLKKNGHIKQKNGYYRVTYRRKSEAKPKGFFHFNKYDVEHVIRTKEIGLKDPGAVVLDYILQDAEKIKDCIEKGKSYTIKFNCID